MHMFVSEKESVKTVRKPQKRMLLFVCLKKLKLVLYHVENKL